MRLRLFLSTVSLAAFAAICPAQDPAGEAGSGEASASSFVPFPNSIPADKVTRDMLGKNTAVVGQILKFDASSGERVPHRLTLVQRSTDAVVVVYWPDVEDRVHGGGGLPHVGQKVSVEGAVSDYRGTLQFRVSNPKKIRLEGVGDAGASAPPSALSQSESAEEAPAARKAELRSIRGAASGTGGGGVMNVSEALKHEAGRGNIMVEGEVKSFKPAANERAPQTLVLTDGTSEIDTILFASGAQGMPEELTREGTRVRVTGQRGEYRGRAQIKLGRPSGLTAAGGAVPASESGGEESDSAASGESASPRAQAAPLKIDGIIHSADFTPEHIGRTVTVAGKFERMIAGEKGSYALLRDSDGPITVFLTPAIADAAAAKMTPGGRVEVRGVVEFSKIRSQFMIAPASAEDIQ